MSLALFERIHLSVLIFPVLSVMVMMMIMIMMMMIVKIMLSVLANGNTVISGTDCQKYKVLRDVEG